MKYEVFLDLEQTIIDTWENGSHCNIENVRNFLSRHTTEFTVFSFAVWNAKDVAYFEKHYKNPLENALECRVKSCPTIEDFMYADTQMTGVKHDNMMEFISLRGKVGAFTSWVRYSGFSHSILVDDTVPNVDILTRDTGDLIRFINVDDLT